MGSRLGRAGGGVGDGGLGLVQCLVRCVQGGGGTGALQRQQLRLLRPHQPGDVAVAVGLAGLFLQPLELRLELAAQVLGARQVGLGGAQLQLGLVPARMQPGDPGGFLQQQPPFVRAGIDQRADAPLADQAGGMRTGGEVVEQRLHVALDPARDFKYLAIVHRGRRRAIGIVDRHHNFGVVARRTVAGTGEDHRVHVGGAQ